MPEPLVTLKVKNYRCFPEETALEFELRSGFVAVVGINNAGKSTVLRLFWEFRPLLQWLSRPIGNHANAMRGSQEAGVSAWQAPSGESVFSNTNTSDLSLTFSWRAVPPGASGDEVRNEVVARIPRGTTTHTLDAYVNGSRLSGEFQIADHYLAVENVRQMDLTPLYSACERMASAMYIGPFRNTINAGGSGNYFDIAVGREFVSAFHTFKSGTDSAQNEAIYQLIQDLKRIFGFNELDLNAEPGGNTLQVFIDGRSFRLNELGAGIAEFILVLGNTLVRRPSVILIDEPESHLHPVLQLDFLTTLASYSRDGAVYLATHNLGLARSACERIYSCRRLALGRSEVRVMEATPRLSEFLGELGYAAYQDLGFEQVLLVEGPTEVKVFQQFLRMWNLDHKVVLLHLGGASMIKADAAAELAEILRISPNVAAIVDSELTSEMDVLDAAHAGFVATCEELGIRVKVLDRRATENYFTAAALKAAFGPHCEALAPFEKLHKDERGWPKNPGSAACGDTRAWK